MSKAQKTIETQGVNDPLLNNLVKTISKDVLKSIQESISRTIRKKLKTSLTSTLQDGEFYRHINENMRNGLQDIYKEISSVKKTGSSGSQEQTDMLIVEASQQLDEILSTTEQATVTIMDIIELHLDLQAEAQELIDKSAKQVLSEQESSRLSYINQQLGNDLTTILTTLSFQDLTGQRIKKIISVLRKIETTVFNLYLSSGLVIKAYETDPKKDLKQIETEANQVISELKGPTRDSSQNNVDDLLAQLGL